MGIFSDIASAAGEFFGGDSGGADLVGAGIGVVGNIIASNTAADAARDAAAVGRAGIDEQIAYLAEGRARGTEALAEGGEAFRDEIGPIANVSARGYTPAQEISLDQASRDDAAALAAGGLRGSGRAITEGVLQSRARREAGFLDENRRRQDAVRLERAGSLEREGTGTANIETGTGAQIGGAAATGGLIEARGTAGAGEIEAASTLASTSLIGRTLGTIAAVTADAEKRELNRREDEPPAGRV